MMKNKILFNLYLLSIVIFASCNNSNENKQNNSDTLVHQRHNHDHESEDIELDNGKKWVVDSTMMIHIKNMQAELKSFESSKSNDYKTLAQKMNVHIDSLTSSCTMEGKAHDELHKWLVPFIELNEDLAKSKDINNTEHLYNEIKESFEEFNKYFE